MNAKSLRVITLILGAASLFCLAAYFLALDDIFDDYASPALIQEYLTRSRVDLPDWTACPLEWRIVRLGFWPMAAFHVVALVGLLRRKQAT
ncbi:MAG: hypothetical protein IT365_24710 [Candidatus Hydrogenedentes bacterium]|nr:hypothetical protein [Candidatus Hydrogenedentota bacterium]